MLSKLQCVAVATLLSSGAFADSGTAIAQPAPSPAGDWQGTLRAGELQTRSAIHLDQRAPGIFTGDIDLPDSGQWNVPLEEVKYKDGVLSFSYRQGSRRFEGRWDPVASAWVGQFHNPKSTFEVAYKAGFLCLPVHAGLNGFWEADTVIQGLRRRFKLRVMTNAHGTYALMDIPELVRTDVAVTALSQQGTDVAFAVPSLGMQFRGALDSAATSIAGKLDARGAATPVAFVRNPAGPPRRTQVPVPPYLYTTEDVRIADPGSSGTVLACTLSLPRNRGPHPAAILLSGSGQQDRDETLVGHKPFLVLADHLARNGTAVLRCDDRGVGGSTGDYRSATLEDFARDAATAADFLAARPDIASARIGLIGHSEGGLVASLIAHRRRVAFVILMAGPGVPIHDLLLLQGEEGARAQGIPEARIAQQRPLRRAILSAMRDAADVTAARKAVETVLVSYGMPPEAAGVQAAQEATPDILRVLRVDPAGPLAKLRMPVLAIIGAKDRQVPPQQNLPALRAALAANEDATVRELPGLNHLFQTAETGAVGEYYDIPETIAPSVLRLMTDWLRERGFADAPAWRGS